jgi:23S rRNA A2030 N6-methylase RlmJ
LETQKLKIFVGEYKLSVEENKKVEKVKSGETFKTVESVQDMILLSSYIDVIRSTFGIPTSKELEGQPLSPLYRSKLRNLILNNLPLLYSGI